MNAPKMASVEETQREIEVLSDRISLLIQEGKITDGAALVAVARALQKQEWMPRAFRDLRTTIITQAALELGRISEQVLRDAGRIP